MFTPYSLPTWPFSHFSTKTSVLCLRLYLPIYRVTMGVAMVINSTCATKDSVIQHSEVCPSDSTFVLSYINPPCNCNMKMHMNCSNKSH